MFTVKKAMRLLLLFTPLWLCPGVQAQPQALDAFEQNHRLGRGVNIIGYDPIWRARDQARFQEKHFQALKAAGFQSVRVNLHPFRYMNATNSWALDSKWLQTLDWVVDRGTAANLQ